jgi:hypothetical protein
MERGDVTVAYRKSPLVAGRVVNPLAMRFGIGDRQTLPVWRGRSGTIQRIPVPRVEHDGARYRSALVPTAPHVAGGRSWLAPFPQNDERERSPSF